MKVITEEMEIHEEWYKEAREVKNNEEMNDFIQDKLLNYSHDYGTICHAIASSMIATMTAMNNDKRQGGITAFQASCIVQQVLMKVIFTGNKIGVRILDLEHLMYPQYSYEFEKIISYDTWEKLQNESKKALEVSLGANQEVRDHWQSIVNGNLPFGFILRDKS